MKHTKGLSIAIFSQNGEAKLWSEVLLKHSLTESSESIPRIMVAGLRVEGTGDLNSRRAQLRLVISVTYCVTWVSYLPPLRLSFFVCYMQITSTLQLLGGSSEVLYHVQALSTAEYKCKSSLALEQEVGHVCTCTWALLNPAWEQNRLNGRGKRPGILGNRTFDLFSYLTRSSGLWYLVQMNTS